MTSWGEDTHRENSDQPGGENHVEVNMVKVKIVMIIRLRYLFLLHF